ncbi:ABC-F family ATP-binding cassette domain-containing protein [Luteimicrobium subarcticum]|uniref:ATPase subunit of ABC transporter with duplicated ATPase domains n=1 Tax=Luteimicrobium subarcticum TaxID=620910 RepID=A0A2M8WT46_9MICO|nr:ABC-F family ATP-binding cassette domain-containing protein [Luteimicrobium subarcticum]PJI94074.1 ATPase subunit of ABC transporter with duplicated ATPase domains [Luteimicrobium subarcticum]
MAHLLGGESLHVEFPTKVVLDAVTVGVEDGDRIGIVGRNGDGKSTLLNLLGGRAEPDAGRVTVRRDVHVGMLDQSGEIDPDLTVRHAVVGDREEHEWASDARMRDVVTGLVADLPWEGRVGDLSGGQRRRVGLANLLVGDWDVLILDEPTNHLDVEGVTWLAEHLKRRWSSNQGGLLVVTHDRWFLDEVCTATWEVHDQIVEPFEGGYAAYVLQRVERDRQAAVVEQKRQNLMRKELAWLRRGAPARTSKPRFRIDAANQLIEDVPPIRDAVELTRLATSRLGKDVVDIVDVSVSYPGPPAADGSPTPDREVLRDVTWRIAPGERTGILGVNGAGKSTLLGLVTGALDPTSGRVKRGKTVNVATLTQELAELKDVGRERVSDVVGRKRTTYQVGTGSSARDLTPGQLLERLGFTSAQLQTPVQDLSGGQRRRLQLLLILLDEPNVLVLDEPTNDMDTDMLTAIEDLLDSWPGTLIVVSHDRYLLERVTDQQYAIFGGRFRHLPGGVDEYLRLRAADPVRTGAEGVGGGDVEGGPGSSRAGRGGSGGSDRGTSERMVDPHAGTPARPSTPALSGAALHAARKEIESIDRRLTRLQKDIDGLHVSMAEHDQSDFVWLGEQTGALRDLEEEVASLEERWLDLSEQVGG